MKDVSNQGRTVIFVSHNLVAVKSLCKTGILMERGNITFSGSADETVEHYMKVNAAQLNPSISFDTLAVAPGNDCIKLKAVSVQPSSPFITDEISIHFSFWNFSESSSVFLAFDVIDLHEEVVFGSGFSFETDKDNLCQGVCSIPADLMNDGVYSIQLYFNDSSMRLLWSIPDVISFEVADKQRNNAYFGKVNGAVRPKLKWNINPKQL